MLRDCRSILVLAALFGALSGGCDRGGGNANSTAGTSAAVGLPETNPPVIDKAVADRFTVGMPQDEALSILQKLPAPGSYFNNVADQGRLNGARYDLTITQGTHTLALHFRDRKLVSRDYEEAK